MIRYIGYVESIDWETNICKVRVPNIDGLGTSAYKPQFMSGLLPNRPPVEFLQDAEIPYHLQGLRVGDVVYVLESEDSNDNYAIVGFYGGVYKEE